MVDPITAGLAVSAAETGMSWFLRKVLPWLIVSGIIIGLGITVYVQHTQLASDVAAIKNAKQEATDATTKANDYAASNLQMHGVIDQLNKVVEGLRADQALSQAAADATAAENQAALDDLNKQLADTQARGNAHPDQVKATGPIVRDVARSVCGAPANAPATTACH